MTSEDDRMLDLLLPTYNFTLLYAQKLVADVADDQMCAQPVPGRTMNHPAFTLGHLAWANESAVGQIGTPGPAAAEWKELFGMGAKPLAERSRYPSKAELLKRLEDAHARLAAALRSASPEALAKQPPEPMRMIWPTVAHMLLGLMTAHEAGHLGQLSAWRRALGLPSVF
jgi:hypothetical protein